jgi:hypothetical protein
LDESVRFGTNLSHPRSDHRRATNSSYQHHQAKSGEDWASLKEGVVSFPWEPAIPQAMQQHGGRNRAFVVRSVAPSITVEDAGRPVAVESPALVPGEETLRAGEPK